MRSAPAATNTIESREHRSNGSSGPRPGRPRPGERDRRMAIREETRLPAGLSRSRSGVDRAPVGPRPHRPSHRLPLPRPADPRHGDVPRIRLPAPDVPPQLRPGRPVVEGVRSSGAHRGRYRRDRDRVAVHAPSDVHDRAIVRAARARDRLERRLARAHGPALGHVPNAATRPADQIEAPQRVLRVDRADADRDRAGPHRAEPDELDRRKFVRVALPALALRHAHPAGVVTPRLASRGGAGASPDETPRRVRPRDNDLGGTSIGMGDASCRVVGGLHPRHRGTRPPHRRHRRRPPAP